MRLRESQNYLQSYKRTKQSGSEVIPLTTRLHSPLKNIGLNTTYKFKQEIFPFHKPTVSLMVPAGPRIFTFFQDAN